jgi:hypothetical protein
MFLKTIIITICFTSLSIYSMEPTDKISQSDREWFRIKLQEYKKARQDKERRDKEVVRLQKAAQHCDIPKVKLARRIGIVHSGAGFQAKL